MKYFRINGLVCLSLLASAWLVQAQTDDPRALIQRAFSLQQDGDYAGAAAAYRDF